MLSSLYATAQETEQQGSTETATTSSTAAQVINTGFIDDNLFIYIHSGPGKNYRILGSVDAGTPISIISEPDNGYIQIVDDKGREAWVEEKFVSIEPGLRQQLESAQQALEDSDAIIQALRDEQPILQQANNGLRAENQRLQQSITELQTALNEQTQASEAKKQKEQHLMLTYGGGVALAGLLFGVALTSLLSRKKRYDEW
jgi:SH3 domain protein